MRFASTLFASAALLAAAPVHAKPADPDVAKKILKDSVAIPTVEGRGKVPELAAYYAGVLKAAGYADSDIEITPMGETDSYHFRAQGVPSYGVAGLFSKASDSFAHGLNERVPVAAIAPALAHWDSLLRDLSK